MNASELLGGGRGRLDLHQTPWRGAVDRVGDRPDPRRVLRVRPGVVLVRGRMSVEESQRKASYAAAGGYGTARLAPASSEKPVIVVGAGAAGLHAAIRVAETGTPAVLVSRKPLHESSSYWAQGGLAAALEPGDTPERHAADTLAAGRGLCRLEAVTTLVEAAPASVQWLVQNGVRFDEDTEGGLALGLEGGHTARRIVHAGGSQTGRALTDRLAAHGRRGRGDRGARGHLGPRDLERRLALLRGRDRRRPDPRSSRDPGHGRRRSALGADYEPVGRDRRRSRSSPIRPEPPSPTWSSASSTPPPSRCRAPSSDGSLITEAVRGEGATLLDASGRRFTDELAPRDQVAAAIGDRMRADGTAHVLYRHARDRPEPLPERLRHAGASRFRPSERTGSRLSGRPLPHGRDRDRPRRPLDARRPLRGRRVRLHRCSRRQPARVQLPHASASYSASARLVASATEATARRGTRCRATWRFAPPTVETRAAVWNLAGPVARRGAALRCSPSDPYPLASLIARAALAREESRGSHRRTDFPLPTPRLDGVHLVLEGENGPRAESWE